MFETIARLRGWAFIDAVVIRRSVDGSPHGNRVWHADLCLGHSHRVRGAPVAPAPFTLTCRECGAVCLEGIGGPLRDDEVRLLTAHLVVGHAARRINRLADLLRWFHCERALPPWGDGS